MKLAAAIASATLIGLTPIAHGAVLFTDDFSTGTSSYTLPSPNGAGADKVNLLSNGFGRSVSIGNATFAIDGLDSSTARVFTGSGGFFDYSSSAGAAGEPVIQYGSSTSSFTVSSNDVLRLNFAAADAPTAAFTTIHVILNPGDPSTNTPDGYDSGTYTVNTAGAQTFDIPLAVAGDLSVSQFEVIFDAPNGNDFRINDLSIQSVPEPAMLGLIAAGGLLALRRRRA